MIFRKPTALLSLSLLLIATAPALSVQAQTTATPIPKPGATAAATSSASNGFCTLAAADCALLATAQANVGTETSFVQTITFRANLSEAGAGSGSVQANGSGAFSLDTTAPLTDTASVLNALQFQLHLVGSAATTSGNADLVLKNGLMYLHTQNLLSWIGVDLNQAIALSQEAQANAVQSPTNIATQQVLLDLLRDPAVKTAAAQIPTLPGWIVQQRLPGDAFLEGQRMAQIQYTYNPIVLLGSSQFGLILHKFAVDFVNDMPADSPSVSQLKSLSNLTPLQTTGALNLISGALGKTNMKYIQWIGEKDKKIHALSVILTLNIVPSALNFGGTNTNSRPPAPINGTISFTVQVTKIGQPVKITTPTVVQMVTEDQLRRSMNLPPAATDNGNATPDSGTGSGTGSSTGSGNASVPTPTATPYSGSYGNGGTGTSGTSS